MEKIRKRKPKVKNKRSPKPKGVDIDWGKLDDLAEYVEKYEKYRDFEERYNEISEALYDLMGDEILAEKNFTHVWGIAFGYEKYFERNKQYLELFPTSNILRMKIDEYLRKVGMNVWSVPDIPMIEYILVPTGNVQSYTAHRTLADAKRERNAIRWREWDWKNRIYDKQEQKYKERKEAYYAEQRSEEDRGTGESDDGTRCEDERR